MERMINLIVVFLALLVIAVIINEMGVEETVSDFQHIGHSIVYFVTEASSFIMDTFRDVADEISAASNTTVSSNSIARIAATMTLSEKITDFNRNPTGWTMTDWAIAPSISEEAPGGTRTEEEWKHTRTGLKIYRYDVQTVEGNSLPYHPYLRATSKIIKYRRLLENVGQ